VISRDSANTLFDQNIATFDDDGGAYNQADAGGFIKLNALRMRITETARRKRAK
jgi:argininosuccinate synthase